MGNMKSKWTLLSVLLASMSISVFAAGGGQNKPPVPDLTNGGTPGENHDINLGPTGARGWVWAWRGHTTDSRQILVTEVTTGSPASDILKDGDVILGVFGKPFASDARIAFARAITEAETMKRGGALDLIRWRDGARKNVTIRLEVMGEYSKQAPYKCKKTERVLKKACRAIANNGFKDTNGNIRVNIQNDLNALLLLASGDIAYHSKVTEYARVVADHQPGGHISWGYAYETLFLAEYALATKDKSVMKGLERLATDIARGQSAVGTWGHSFARDDKRLKGYGCINQPGIVLTLAMALAREAGVKSHQLNEAIGKSGMFLQSFVEKGAVPYGDHGVWPWHDNNGACSSAAVLFDSLGEGRSTRYYSRMGMASYLERESGHTGNFFNILWALPGVSRCGPKAASAYFKEQTWYYDLARKWDGTCSHQLIPGANREVYSKWDCTGTYLLGYALPRKKLFLTGKRKCSTPSLTRKEIEETIDAGRDFNFWDIDHCYDGRKTEDLIKGISSWSPAVRRRSGQSLSRREGDFVQKLIEMLDDSNRHARYGACEALGYFGPKADSAGKKVRLLLKDDDAWMRSLAAVTLARMGEGERKSSIDDMLKAICRKDPNDPRGRVQAPLAQSLFSPAPGKREPRSILEGSLDGVDRSLLYPAIREILNSDDGCIRARLSRVYPKLAQEDIKELMPDILTATKELSASGMMFADGIRLAGLDLLSKLRIEEGMDMALELIEPGRWGQANRIPRCTEYLSRYGIHAHKYLPRLKELRKEKIKNDSHRREDNPDAVRLQKGIEKIEKNKTEPELQTIEEYLGK